MSWFSKKKSISFKEAIDLTGFPIITFENNGKKYNFLLDTGSNQSVLHSAYIEEMNGIHTGEATTLSGLDGIEREVMFYKVSLIYDSKELIECFQVTDLSAPFEAIKKECGVMLHGILGNSFFIKYKSLIDFNKLKFQI